MGSARRRGKSDLGKKVKRDGVWGNGRARVGDCRQADRNTKRERESERMKRMMMDGNTLCISGGML